MADFDEYRKKWKYHCNNCNADITAYRDCGETSPCRCGSNLKLIEVIEPKHIEYSGNNYTAVHTFKPYFDVTLGKVVESKAEIKEYCAKNDCVYADDKDLTIDCQRNKKYNAEKQEREFQKNLVEKLMSL